VTYLDAGRGAFATTLGGETFTTALRDTGRWQIALFKAHAAATSEADVFLAADTDVVLHLIEVAR